LSLHPTSGTDAVPNSTSVWTGYPSSLLAAWRRIRCTAAALTDPQSLLDNTRSTF
jgi:hypothetical protein